MSLFQERICKIQGACYDDDEAMDPERQCMRCNYDTAENEWTQEVRDNNNGRGKRVRNTDTRQGRENGKEESLFKTSYLPFCK